MDWQYILSLLSVENVAFTIPAIQDLFGINFNSYPVSWIELSAVFFGLMFILLAKHESILCFPVGIVQFSSMVTIFYQMQLYSDMLLNIYSLGLCIFGIMWWFSRDTEHDTGKKLEVRYLSNKERAKYIGLILIMSYLLGTSINVVFTDMANLFVIVANYIGFNLPEYTHVNASFPYFDATTTVTSLVAMYLMAKKYVESWILWIVVQVICVPLYFVKGSVILSAEYLVFMGISVFGLIDWSTHAKELKINYAQRLIKERTNVNTVYTQEALDSIVRDRLEQAEARFKEEQEEQANIIANKIFELQNQEKKPDPTMSDFRKMVEDEDISEIESFQDHSQPKDYVER